MSLKTMIRDLNQSIDAGQLNHESAAAVLAAWGKNNLTGGLTPEEASKLLTDDRK